MRTEPCKGLEHFLKFPYLQIWEIGNSSGLRISDIITLKVEQLYVEKPTIKEQKTGKSKRIYIPKKTRLALLAHCKECGRDEYVFKSKSKTGHITRQAVFKAFKKAGQQANVKNNVGTHTMRKNYALKQFSKEHDLKFVQDKLNHAHLSDTVLYLLNGKE